jgi:hypothetical protein
MHKAVCWLAMLLLLASGIVGVPALAQAQDDSADNLIAPGEYIVGTIELPGNNHGYYFNAVQGQIVRISMWAGEQSRLDALLVLTDPNGTVITTDDNSGEGANAYIEATLPQDGTYGILAGGVGATIGAYGLTFSLAGPGIPPLAPEPLPDVDPTLIYPGGQWLAPGEAATGTIDYVGDQGVYYFMGIESQTVRISMWAGSGSGLDSIVKLIGGPEWRTVATDSDSAGYPDAYLVAELPFSGPYIILAQGIAPTTGAYGLDLNLSAPQIFPPDVESGTLGSGESVRGFIQFPGDEDRFTFDARVGQIIYLSMWRQQLSDVDSRLVLIAPGGDVLAMDDDSLTGRDALISLQLPQTGTYVVIASGALDTIGGYGLGLNIYDPL